MHYIDSTSRPNRQVVQMLFSLDYRPGTIVTRLNCNNTFISRIPYQATTLFAQRMRYVTFAYRVQKLT